MRRVTAKRHRVPQQRGSRKTPLAQSGIDQRAGGPRLAQLVQNLDCRIHADPQAPLPSINGMAREYSVSYVTMWRAVRILARSGILAVSQGRKAAVAPALSGNGAPRTEAQRLCKSIKTCVLDGTYPAGKPLPKIGHLTDAANVSAPTVTRALVELAAEGLTHKRRGRWHAGPLPAVKSSPTAAIASADTPVVLLITSSAASFSYTLGDPFTHSFFAHFFSELTPHAHQVQPALMSEASERSPTAPAGLDQTRSLIRKLGPRYRGSVLLTAFPRESDMESWIGALVAFGKPVVFFDNSDAGAYLTRRSLGIKTGYFRLHMDEQAAILLAIRTLIAAGHKSIGIHGANLYDWAQRRTLLITECAARLTPPLPIVTARPAEPVWSVLNRPNRFDSIVTTVAARPPVDSAARFNARDALLHATPSLACLLRDHSPTALLALNDESARDYYFWLKAMGIRVPHDISMLSFDNVFESHFFPVTTIDFGFPRLGYLAAHLFIGDIPVRAGRDGTVPGECTLVNRGSLAPPGDAAVLQRVLRG